MRLWKRRLAVVLAVAAGSAGVMMSTAGAQTSPPTSIPDFTFPSFTFPTFPTIPPPTMPPPTMPPSTSPPTSSPPPTMPPVTSPPSSPPTSVPFSDFDEIIERLLDDLENFIEEGEAGYEEFQSLLDRLRADFLG